MGIRVKGKERILKVTKPLEYFMRCDALMLLGKSLKLKNIYKVEGMNGEIYEKTLKDHM